MNGLKRLSGAKKVDLAKFEAPVGHFTVTFDKAPKLGAADLKKVVNKRFTLKKLSLRVTVPVARAKKGKGWTAIGLTLKNPKKGKDFLARIKEYVEAGKKTLVLSGELTENKKGKRSLTLDGVAVPAKKEKK